MAGSEVPSDLDVYGFSKTLMGRAKAGARFVQIAVADEVVYALDADGRVWVWEADVEAWVALPEERVG